MKVIQKITLFAVLLLLPAVSQAQTPQTLQGMTIFDSNSIHIENNSLATHNIFTVVLTDKDAPVVIAFNSTPPSNFQGLTA